MRVFSEVGLAPAEWMIVRSWPFVGDETPARPSPCHLSWSSANAGLAA